VDEAVAAAVRARAGGRCEYCLVPTTRFVRPFEIEHVIARKHGGTDAFGNLALACPHCNQHKGTDLSGIDRITSRTKLVRLFNPRRHRWDYHFTFDGPRIVGLTPIGRVTVAVLNMNDPMIVFFREELIAEGLFPPGG
jgi:hypothetical protein